MKKKIMVIVCFLLLATPILSFAQDKKGPSPGLSADERAKGKTALKRSNDSYNNKTNKATRRAKRRAKKREEIEKRKSDKQTGHDAQINMQF